jgi:hypothetical protein
MWNRFSKKSPLCLFKLKHLFMLYKTPKKVKYFILKTRENEIITTIRIIVILYPLKGRWRGRSPIPIHLSPLPSHYVPHPHADPEAHPESYWWGGRGRKPDLLPFLNANQEPLPPQSTLLKTLKEATLADKSPGGPYQKTAPF